jgi:hypothetical protein
MLIVQPLMLIVPDVQDVYTPLETDVVVQLSEVSSGSFVFYLGTSWLVFPLFVNVSYKLATIIKIGYRNFFLILFVFILYWWEFSAVNT